MEKKKQQNFIDIDIIILFLRDIIVSLNPSHSQEKFSSYCWEDFYLLH